MSTSKLGAGRLFAGTLRENPLDVMVAVGIPWHFVVSSDWDTCFQSLSPSSHGLCL